MRADAEGNLVPLKASNIDWEDMNTIVHDLTSGQTPKIYIQPDELASSSEQPVSVSLRN